MHTRFGPIDFENLNEADVREEILAPLLRDLGYRSGTRFDVIREQSLRYPKISLGLKNPAKDPLVRGKADYVCEIDGGLRWVLEAKSAAEELTEEVIHQAFSYAVHAEIAAVYFCVSNGRRIQFYQTNHGPHVPPILALDYGELNGAFQTIQNLVGPEALLRDHPKHKIDAQRPLGPGLRSLVRVASGHIVYEGNTLGSPVLNGLTISITDGAIQRENGRGLIAYIKSLSPYEALQRLNEKLGLSKFEVSSIDDVLSASPDKPTIFEGEQEILLPSGESILNLQTWTEVVLPRSISCNIKVSARGWLESKTFQGHFESRHIFLEINLRYELKGRFKLHLS